MVELQMTDINNGVSHRIIQHDPATGIIDGVSRLVSDDPTTANTQVRLIKEVLFEGTEDPTSLETQRVTFEFEIPGSVWLSVGTSDVYLEVRLPPFFRETPFNDQVAIPGAILIQGVAVVEYTVKVTGLTQDNITEGEINSDFVEKYRNSFQFADVPNFNFSNGFLREQTRDPILGGILTTVWEEDFTGLGGSEFLPLVERWLRDGMQPFHTARFELDIEARSDLINVSDLIDELEVTGKRYVITGLAYNTKWAVAKLSLIEFVKDDDVKIVE